MPNWAIAPPAAVELAESWPEEFKSGEGVIVTAEKGLLRFDTRAELEALRDGAEQLLESAQP